MNSIEQTSGTPGSGPTTDSGSGGWASGPSARRINRGPRRTTLPTATESVTCRDLTAETAHDFNNLLSVILTCATELESQPDDPVVVRDGAAEIRSAAERGARLSQHLIESVRYGPSRRERVDPERDRAGSPHPGRAYLWGPRQRDL